MFGRICAQYLAPRSSQRGPRSSVAKAQLQKRGASNLESYFRRLVLGRKRDQP